MSCFAIEHLDGDHLVDAWPVVRMSEAYANCDWWMSEAKALAERGGGILVARAPGRNIHGVATYAVTRKPLFGRALVVDTLVTFELIRRAPARQALYEALELLANAFECRSIVLPLTATSETALRRKMLYDLPNSGPEPDLS